MEFEKYAQRIINKYQKILLLDKYTFTLKKTELDKNELMAAQFAYPYLEIEIYYGDSVIKDYKKNKKSVNQAIIHELVHALTDPIYAKSTKRFTSHEEILDEREALTDHIANIIVKNGL